MIRRTLIVVVGVLFAAPTWAGNVFIHIVAGQSNAYGMQEPFTPKADDKRISLFPEVGVIDGNTSDATADEYPVGSPLTAPRWEQTVSRSALKLGPVRGRWGADIAIGRLNMARLQSSGIAGRVAIAKFAIGGSNLNTQWFGDRAGTVNLAERLKRFLLDVRAEVERNGGRVRWASFTWIQGESDCMRPADASAYLTNLRKLRGLVRGIAPGIPIVVALTSADLDYAPAESRATIASGLQTVNAAKAQFVRETAKSGLVATGTLVHRDLWHFRQDQYDLIGNRVFKEYLRVK